MADLPVFIFIICVILFLLYLSYVAFSLAVEHEGPRSAFAAIAFVIFMLVAIFLIYGLYTQDPNVIVYHRKSS